MQSGIKVTHGSHSTHSDNPHHLEAPAEQLKASSQAAGFDNTLKPEFMPASLEAVAALIQSHHSDTKLAAGSFSARPATSDRSKAASKNQFRKTAPASWQMQAKLEPINEKVNTSTMANSANSKILEKALEDIMHNVVQQLMLEAELNNKKVKHLEQTSQVELRKINQTFSAEMKRIAKLEEKVDQLSKSMQTLIGLTQQLTQKAPLPPARLRKVPAVKVTLSEAEAKKYLGEASRKAAERANSMTPSPILSLTQSPNLMSAASSYASSGANSARPLSTKSGENVMIGEEPNHDSDNENRSLSYSSPTNAKNTALASAVANQGNPYALDASSLRSANSQTQGTFANFIPPSKSRRTIQAPVEQFRLKPQTPLVQQPSPRPTSQPAQPAAAASHSRWCCFAKSAKVLPANPTATPPAHSSPATNTRGSLR